MTTCFRGKSCTAKRTSDGDYFCYQCQQTLSSVTSERTGHTSQIDNESIETPDAEAFDGAEKVLAHGIVRALEARGSVVFQVSQRGGKDSGTTVGCPDLFASVKGNVALFRGIEVKPLAGVLSTEQEEFVRRGATAVARSVKRALQICGYEE